MAATLALTMPSSAAHNLLSLRNSSLASAPLNITNPALKAPEEITNLTYSPWPEQPFGITLLGPGLLFLNVYLLIGAGRKFQSSPMVSVTELRHFLQDFVDNIKREHPVPGSVPRHATQSTIDISSYTKWLIAINEGPFRGRLPTAVALVAFDALGKLVGRYGPSEIIWGIKEVGARTPWAYGSLTIESIEGFTVNKSSSIENGGSQTA